MPILSYRLLLSFCFAALTTGVSDAQTSERFPIVDPTFESQVSLDKQLREKVLAIQREDEEKRRLQQQLIENGYCDRPGEPIPDLCTYSSVPYSHNAIHVPRFAAPYQVQLVKSSNWMTNAWLSQNRNGRPLWELEHQCGASLIAREWVVTAAHCLKSTRDPKYYGVRLDADNISESRTAPLAIKEIIAHPQYNFDLARQNYLNDIALLRISVDDEVIIDRKLVAHNDQSIISAKYHEDTNLFGVLMSSALYQLVDVESGKVLSYNTLGALNTGSASNNIDEEVETAKQSIHGFLVSSPEQDSDFLAIKHSGRFNPNGSENPSKISVWDIKNRKISHSFEIGLAAHGAAFADNNRLIVLWSEFGDVEVWEMDPPRLKQKSSLGIDMYFSVVKPYDKGRKLFVGHLEGSSESWDLKTGRLNYERNHSLPVHSYTFTPDNSLYITRSNFGTAEVWDLNTGTAKARIFHGHTISGAQVVNDGKTLITWGGRNIIKFWDLSTGKEYSRIVASVAGGGQAQNFRLPNLVETTPISKYASDITQAEAVTVTGWGKTANRNGAQPSAILGLVGLKPISRENCLQTNRWEPHIIQDDKAFCAGDKERKTCYGDSGGPVMANGKLVGIVSWGSGKCTDDKVPGVYTKVPSYYPWIKSTICNRSGLTGSRPALCED